MSLRSTQYCSTFFIVCYYILLYTIYNIVVDIFIAVYGDLWRFMAILSIRKIDTQNVKY